jgi:hypothetical protein
MYRIIHDTADDSATFVSWEEGTKAWLLPDKMLPAVREARKALHADLVRRWKTELPPAQKSMYAICTLLDPRFKEYDFLGASAEEKEWALSELKNAWDASAFKPKSTPPAEHTQARQEPPEAAQQPRKHGVSALSVLSRPAHPSGVLQSPTSNEQVKDKPKVDELEAYLALPAANMETDVLVWWRKQDSVEGIPSFAKFARQHLGSPASSAGVERLFSRAGRMHDNLKASMADDTLMHSLFAAKNFD